MNAKDIATAITNALVQGGGQWVVSTIVAFLPALWTMSLVLHLGRPYVLRTLRRCGLRLGADVWWMTYLLMRDALLVVTFALSWIFFLPNIVTSAALPITGPLAALCLLLALAVKLSRRVDDEVSAYRLATGFLVAGATLYYLPLVFAVESTSQEHLSWLIANLTSSSSVSWALGIMWASLVGVALVLAWFFVRAFASASRMAAPRAPMQARRSTPAAPVRAG